MKIWIVDNKKVFKDETSFMNFLIREKTKGVSSDKYKIEILDAKVIENTTVGDLFKAIKESRISEHENKMSTDPDSFFEDLENLKKLYYEYTRCEDSPFLTNVAIRTGDKAGIIKIVRSYEDHLCFDVSDSVVWFKALLKIYNFKEIKDGTYKKLNGWNTKVIASKKRVNNFLDAKKLFTGN